MIASYINLIELAVPAQIDVRASAPASAMIFPPEPSGQLCRLCDAA
jgi:hypothetical protein